MGSVMNTGCSCHISEETLEKYAFGRAPDAHRPPLDQHLLVCPTCQIRLQELEEYIEVMKAATARASCGVISKAPVPRSYDPARAPRRLKYSR
jgi:hypothetical protein